MLDYLKYIPPENRAAMINVMRLQAIKYGDYPDECDNPNGMKILWSEQNEKKA